MASIINGLSYETIREMQVNGGLNFDELTEAEICILLDDAIDHFEIENSDENEALISACLAALDRFPQYLPKVNDEKILSEILAAQRKHKSSSKFHIRKSKALISIAATIALLFSITAVAYASGYNIFELIFNRTPETLNIGITNQDSSQAASSDTATEIPELIDKEYDDFDIFVTENPNAKLPAYIPDGMEFDYGQMSIDSSGEVYNLVFINKETKKDIAMIIEIFNENFAGTTELEIDNEHSEQYLVEGITHYIESNMGSYSVVWFNGNRSYYIGTSLSLEETKKIIDSYYGG